MVGVCLKIPSLFFLRKKKRKKILVVICWLLWFQCQRAGSSGRFTDGSVPRFQLNPFELRRNNWAEIKGNWHHSAVKLRQILFLWKESFFCFFLFFSVQNMNASPFHSFNQPRGSCEEPRSFDLIFLYFSGFFFVFFFCLRHTPEPFTLRCQTS